MLHLIAFETRDRLIWEVRDALGKAREDEAGEVLRTAATAVLSDEAWGAHMQGRNEERVARAFEAMQRELGRELDVKMRPGPPRGLRRPR